MDAVSGRCRLRSGRIADGVGFHRQTPAPVPPIHRASDFRTAFIRNAGNKGDGGGVTPSRRNDPIERKELKLTTEAWLRPLVVDNPAKIRNKADDYQILESTTKRHIAETVPRAAKFRCVALVAD